jgi:hypothetical protein
VLVDGIVKRLLNFRHVRSASAHKLDHGFDQLCPQVRRQRNLAVHFDFLLE